MTHSHLPGALFAALTLAGCTSAPLTTIPEPYPETLEWASAGSADGGTFLGLKVRENDSGSLDDLFFEPGVRVTHVIENSPARQAGFAVGDIVLAWNGEPLEDPRGLQERLRAASPGDGVQLETRRGDTVFEVAVELNGTRAGESAPAPETLYRVDPSRSRAGWLGGRGGVVLVSSDESGPFPGAGVAVGSVVLAIDGEPVRSERALIRRLQALEPGSAVQVEFDTPEGERRTAEVDLIEAPTKVTDISIPILFQYTSGIDDDETTYDVIDLWIISLMSYRRDGGERQWSFLRFFTFSKGVGELTE